MYQFKSLIYFLPVSLLMLSCAGPAPEEKEKIEPDVELVTEIIIDGEELVYNTEDTEMRGYIAFNESDTSKRPGVLVVHEWWGHNDYVRERAEMLAELGFVALAVDMYGDGKEAAHPEDAAKFSGMVMQNMDLAEERFTKAIEVLQNHPMTDPEKISAVGYCFGGSLILTMANKGIDLDAVAAFHSGVQLPVPPSEELKARVLVQNGAEDPFVSAISVSRFKMQMDSLDKNYTYIAYADAVHGYTNPGADSLGKKFELPLAYNEEADTKSWEELKKMFSEIYPSMGY